LEQNGYSNGGSLKISEEVLSTIAGLAASEVNGVSGLTSCPNPDFKGFLRSKRGVAKAIRIDIKDGEATLDVYVSLYLGKRIPDVANEIQTRVKDAIQTMTGITVLKVNVHVAGVTIKSDTGATE
jgi:uncharacterized alkaline shock family protein YloU